MSKSKPQTVFECGQCGWSTPRWAGRCGRCGEWDALVEQRPRQGSPGAGGRLRGPGGAGDGRGCARPIAQIDPLEAEPQPTGIAEFDRVLGGGIVPGSVVLLAGEPGVGKSTLLLDVAARAARAGRRVLYATGEESVQQVRLRAERTGAVADGLLLAALSDFGDLADQVEATDPALLLVDSIQTISDPAAEGAMGGVTQVRAVTAGLVALSKARGMATVLVGHVTKDGLVAGPRTLEHLVDVVCSFEGERHTSLRLLRALKNRHGSADELGCFELGGHGIREVADPSALFLRGAARPVSGTCVGIALEGRRPMAVEIQALVAPCPGGQGRRTAAGLDPARLAMVLAVLQRRCGVSLGACEIYAATVGGACVREPGIDLALALACASGRWDAPIDPECVAFGEVGLAGEVRGVRGLERRLAEAARLGFKRAIVPVGAAKALGEQARAAHGDLALIEVATVREATRSAIAAGSQMLDTAAVGAGCGTANEVIAGR